MAINHPNCNCELSQGDIVYHTSTNAVKCQDYKTLLMWMQHTVFNWNLQLPHRQRIQVGRKGKIFKSLWTRSGTPWFMRLCAPHHNNAKILINKALGYFFYLTSYQIVFVFWKVHALSFPKMYNSPYALKKYLPLGHHVILVSKSPEWVVVPGLWLPPGHAPGIVLRCIRTWAIQSAFYSACTMPAEHPKSWPSLFQWRL